MKKFVDGLRWLALVMVAVIITVFQMGCALVELADEPKITGDVPAIGQVVHVFQFVSRETESSYEHIMIWEQTGGSDKIMSARSDTRFFPFTEEGKTGEGLYIGTKDREGYFMQPVAYTPHN